MSGYYGYTEGELVIVSGDDGTVGVQLRQGFPKHRPAFRRIPGKPAPLGVNERKAPAKIAVAQALRIELGLGVVDIGKMLKMAPQDVSRATVGDYFRGIPWECRKNRAEAIAAAESLLVKMGRPAAPKPCKAAIAQAMRFELGLGVTAIAQLLGTDEQVVTRATVDCGRKGIPWESRPNQAAAIEAAKCLAK